MSPPVGVLQPGDHAQQRGLAAARRPDEHHKLAMADGRGRCRATTVVRSKVLTMLAEFKCGHVRGTSATMRAHFTPALAMPVVM